MKKVVGVLCLPLPETSTFSRKLQIYCGKNVGDGMYDSLNCLMVSSLDQHNNNPSYLQAMEKYNHIIK